VIPSAEQETSDRLDKIKGIGPATEKVFKSAGVKTFGQLAKMTAADVTQVLKAGGINKSEAAKGSSMKPRPTRPALRGIQIQPTRIIILRWWLRSLVCPPSIRRNG
jgi:hypothetical protein